MTRTQLIERLERNVRPIVRTEANQTAFFRANDKGKRERFIHLSNLVRFYANPNWAGHK